MTSDRSAQIIGKARELGAAIAGIASVELLQESPSHMILGKYGTKIDGVHSFEGMTEGFNEIKWPAPGRDGCFSRARCYVQMDKDVEGSGMAVAPGFLSGLDKSALATEGISQTERRLKWCRRCELACPVGR